MLLKRPVMRHLRIFFLCARAFDGDPEKKGEKGKLMTLERMTKMTRQRRPIKALVKRDDAIFHSNRFEWVNWWILSPGRGRSRAFWSCWCRDCRRCLLIVRERRRRKWGTCGWGNCRCTIAGKRTKMSQSSNLSKKNSTHVALIVFLELREDVKER